MSEIVIGKHTLESLTSGMYSDPFVIYREYIQNSTDSIDDAIQNGILLGGEGKIEIYLNQIERVIRIEDNGLGIPGQEAESTLINIGDSKKSSENSRGFRGIGRLSALSYCDELVFETSYKEEQIGTRFIINAKKLAELLSSEESDAITVGEVLQRVYHVETFQESASKHYFRVILSKVSESSGLLKRDDVADYISQHAPVPYDQEQFKWGAEIEKRLKQEGYAIRHYNILLNKGDHLVAVHKPYTDQFPIDKDQKTVDQILDIQLVRFELHNHTQALGWIAKTNCLGSIYEKSIKGIRLRKGNILIGDSQTLNSVFKDPRFNGWCIGEIFAIGKKLIPNARRDGFEKNTEYYFLHDQLTSLASNITKGIRNASLKRNAELSKALKKSSAVKHEVEVVLQKDVLSGAEKGNVHQKLTSTINALSLSNVNSRADEYFREIAFEELDILIGKLQGVTSYKAVNILENLSNSEKKILERVFNVLVTVSPENANKLIEEILRSFL